MAKVPRPQLSVAQASRVFNLLSDEPRLRLLLLLAEQGETCVTDLAGAIGMSQPAVSHHLALLRMSGVVSSRRDGKFIRYSLVSDHVRHLLRSVKD